MLMHHADAELDCVLRRADVGDVAVVCDLARVGADEAVDDVHEGRLAGPVFPQQRVDLTPFDGQVHRVIGSEAAEGLDDPSELERWFSYPVYPVCRVPLASFACASWSICFRSAGTFESKSWNADTPMPWLVASKVSSPVDGQLFLTMSVIAVLTAAAMCFSALVTRHLSASGYETNWSTSTPMHILLACTAASSAPLPV